MIQKKYINKLVFGNKPEDIECYDDAINSTELYVPHHVLEWKYTVDELKAMNRYENVKASDLIWMTRRAHNGNLVLHKGFRIMKEKMKGKTKRSSKVPKLSYEEYLKRKNSSLHMPKL